MPGYVNDVGALRKSPSKPSRTSVIAAHVSASMMRKCWPSSPPGAEARGVQPPVQVDFLHECQLARVGSNSFCIGRRRLQKQGLVNSQGPRTGLWPGPLPGRKKDSGQDHCQDHGGATARTYRTKRGTAARTTARTTLQDGKDYCQEGHWQDHRKGLLKPPRTARNDTCMLGHMSKQSHSDLLLLRALGCLRR
jgi:hypothetical protein